jgi:cytidylate kinase
MAIEPATRPTVVVTISRQIGSGGASIGQAVARRLGLKYADRAILERAARMLDLPTDDLAPLEERSVSLWERIAHLFVLGPPEGLYFPPVRPDLWEDRLFEIESRIIREMAAQGDAVIVGRAGFHLLRDYPDVVRVFVYAPDAWRARRIMDVYHMGDEAGARSLLKQLDDQRAKFVETVVGGSWMDAIHSCDLGVNTATLGMDAAVDLVCQAVTLRLGARPK